MISDNAFAYRNSRVFHQTAADLGIVQKFIRPHCPLDQRQGRAAEPDPGH